MNISKKVLSVFLAFVMLLIALPLSGIKTYATDPSDFSYNVIDETEKTAEITGYNGSGGDVVIPSTIDGYTIVSLGDTAFGQEPNFTIQSLTIPNSIEYIDPYSVAMLFMCTEFIVDSNNLLYSSFDGVLFNKNMTELVRYPSSKQGSEYVVPLSVLSICQFSFFYCFNLVSVVIPENVNTIMSLAFVGSESLAEVDLSEGLLSIGSMSFTICSSLSSIYIPPTTVTIADDAFKDSGLSIIYGITGSSAQNFAENNGFTFADISALMPFGDMNKDKVCNEIDFGIMMNIASGIVTPTLIQSHLGDVNNDGVIDGFDIAALDVKLYENID